MLRVLCSSNERRACSGASCNGGGNVHGVRRAQLERANQRQCMRKPSERACSGEYKEDEGRCCSSRAPRSGEHACNNACNGARNGALQRRVQQERQCCVLGVRSSSERANWRACSGARSGAKGNAARHAGVERASECATGTRIPPRARGGIS